MKVITRSLALNCGETINIRYIIKEEERKVIAITDDIPYTVSLVINLIQKKYKSFGMFIIPDTKELYLNERYRTVATCNEEDVWDTNKGIEVAKSKMKIKLDRAVTNRLSNFIDRNQKILNVLFSLG